jgi:hypothetical protein
MKDVSVTRVENPSNGLQMLVTVSEDVFFSERTFRERMTLMVNKAVEHVVTETLKRYSDAMTEILDSANLTNLVIAELQKRVQLCPNVAPAAAAGLPSATTSSSDTGTVPNPTQGSPS